MFDLAVDILQTSTLVLNDEGQNTIQYNTIWLTKAMVEEGQSTGKF